MNKLIRSLVLVVLCAAHSLFADVPNFEYIFSRPYIGFLRYQPGDSVEAFDAPREGARLPNLATLKGGCIRGGGGDCECGTLYLKKAADPKGRMYFLVETVEGKDVWIRLGEGVTAEPLDIRVGMGGSEITFRPGAERSDTRTRDGVPLFGREERAALSKVRETVSPQLGVIQIRSSQKTKKKTHNVTIWSSFDIGFRTPFRMPEEKFVNLLQSQIQPTSFPFERIISLDMVRRHGNRFLVVVQGEDWPVGSFFEEWCGGKKFAFWVDLSNFQSSVETTPSNDRALEGPSSSFSPIQNPLVYEAEGIVVTEVRPFKGTLYARLERRITAFDPLHRAKAPQQGTLAERGFRIPLGWHRIRDAQGRLRFWFASVSC